MAKTKEKIVYYPNLRAEMARHGDNLEDIGKLLDVAASSVTRRLSGEIQWNINENNILCAHYNMKYEELFVRE